MWRYLLVVPLVLCGEIDREKLGSAEAHSGLKTDAFVYLDMESSSMLFQAAELARKFSPSVSRAKEPKCAPRSDALLEFASSWLAIELDKVEAEKESTLKTLANQELWDALAELGIDAVELKGLKLENGAFVSLRINSKWGSDSEYAELAGQALRRGIRLIGSSVGKSTGKGPDFALALKNYGDYPSLYSMVEIDRKDWDALPKVPPTAFSVNIPWMTLQALQKKGYVPKDFTTYVKTSDWNATEPIAGIDGKQRRWIYLRDRFGLPCLEWMRPSFASERLAAGDALQNLHQLGQKVIEIEEGLPRSAREDLSLLLRKLEIFSAARISGGVAALKEKSADLLYDELTPLAAFHAWIAEDAEALRLMYRLLLEEKVQPKRLVHSLEPFRESSCDWAEFLASPKRKYKYYEQELTGEALRRRLIQEDLLRITGQPTGESLRLSTWAASCDQALQFENLELKASAAAALYALLAKFFCWQPGAFCLSAQELVGSPGKIDLMRYRKEALYAPLPAQLQTASSFGSQLKRILRVRSNSEIARAELVDVPLVKDRGLLILRYKLSGSGFSALLGVNFGSKPAAHRFDDPRYASTSAIDLSTQLAEEKLFDSSVFELKLEPLSAKLVLFQPNYYK